MSEIQADFMWNPGNRHSNERNMGRLEMRIILAYQLKIELIQELSRATKLNPIWCANALFAANWFYLKALSLLREPPILLEKVNDY